LGETVVYQDWQATHVVLPKITRRVRLYPQARQAPELSRQTLRQAAEREFGKKLIEDPKYKRRGETKPWEEQEKRALRGWLLDRLETASYGPEAQL
jgi:hypothetical protein